MLVIMLVSLYTTRIILAELGVNDYGIYDVVAGVVTSLAFISQTLSSALQRFLSYAIGKQNHEELNEIFSASLAIFILIGVACLLIGETLGLWLVNNLLNIPENRLVAANIVYQFALFSFLITILSIPFISEIIAHEEMGIYSFVGIIDYTLKLGVAFILIFTTYDNLILYGFLSFLITLITFLIYYFVTKVNFSECNFKIPRRLSIFKELLSYSGWTLLGTVSGIANNQGNSILINVFFSPVVNAARAIALQVIGVISAFANNFFTSFRPPLIKSYAEENYIYTMQLFYSSSKLSFILMLVICLPIYIEMETILNLWLKNTTLQMITFTKLALIYAMIVSLNNPITTLIQATGKIRNYFVFVESFTLLSLPITYFSFKLGYPPEATFWGSIIVFSIAHIVRLIILKNTVIQFTISRYLDEFIRPSFIISILSSIIPFFIVNYFPIGLFRLFIVFSTSSILIVITFYFIGLNIDEQKFLCNIIKDWISRK